jgi:hypothetical protein
MVLTEAETMFLLGVQPWTFRDEIACRLTPVDARGFGRPTRHYHLGAVTQLFAEIYGRQPRPAEIDRARRLVQGHRTTARATYHNKNQLLGG